MPDEMLKLTVDKFTFLIPKNLLFSRSGVWIKLEGSRARLGLSDFAQQNYGDIAFAEVKPEGTKLAPGDEMVSIETVKVDVSLSSPVKGTIVEINPSLQEAAELINQDPYGNGWLAVVEHVDWENDRIELLDADAYLALVAEQAEEEMKK
jgi:glycine cleavage system H protein